MQGEALTQDIPRCAILGVQLAATHMEQLVDFTTAHVEALSGEYMTVANVHTTVMAFEDEAYRAVQNGAILAIPDGGPLSALGRRRGFPDMRRTTGPDYMGEIFALGGGYRHYFYGSTEDTLHLLRRKLEERYPGIQIAGMYSPPFRPLSAQEKQSVIERINESRADFVWIGLGAPKQEVFMAEHRGLVKGFMVGVGAGFDYYAGKLRRAPMWMQRNNLEWLYRLMQEPRRLFFRYWRSNWKFIWHAVLCGR